MSYQFDSRIATCSSESWMTNSLGQSPCQVGTVLAYRACGWNQYYLGQLNPPDFAGYADVSSAEATACRCNTVTFMLVSACAICQGGENADWISYSRECWGTVTQPSQGVYPGTLPSGIAVPAWAYWVSGRPNFQFSTAIAKDFAGPDSTRPGSSPSTSTTPPSSTSTTTAAGTTTTTSSGTTSTTGTSTGTSDTTSGTGTSTTGTSTGTTGTSSGASGSTSTGGGGDGVAIPSDAPQQGNSGANTTGGDAGSATSKSTNVGAIAGGVVGGVIALLLLGLLILCLLRRRRARASLREAHPEMSAVQGGVATDGGPVYDDFELPPDYAAVYGGESSAGDGVEDSTEEAGSASAQATSTSRPAAGSSTSKFPDPHAPLPSTRIQSVHKPPLP